MPAFPLTPNGKIDRKALPAPEGARPTLERAYEAPNSALEREIAALWREALHVDRAGVHDNFFELGGHSLLLAQVHARLQQMLSVDLPIVKLFQYPTIASLAQYLSLEQAPTGMAGNVEDRARRQRAALAARRRRGRLAEGGEHEP